MKLRAWDARSLMSGSLDKLLRHVESLYSDICRFPGTDRMLPDTGIISLALPSSEIDSREGNLRILMELDVDRGASLAGAA
jgi:hypothetical protein